MKHYIKNKEKKSRKEIVIRKDGKQIINPTEEQILADGWEVYAAPTPTEEQKLVSAKRLKKQDVDYRKNHFLLKGEEITIDSDMLNKTLLRVMAESAMHKNKTSLWFNNIKYDMKTKDALELLYNLAVYIGECFDVSQNHKANIDNLTTEEDVQAYDIENGYPEKVEY